MVKRVMLGAAALLAGVAGPALADVKAGVDAWNRGEYRKAVDEWRGAAVAGDADAQFNLGQAYKLGRGVPVDLALAEEWYRKAAAQGHPQAEDNYGLALFQNGKRDRALPWLERSSTRGEPRAQYVLGTMFFNGDTVKRDPVRAYALMTRAHAAGLPQAAATLAQMDRYIGLQDRQRGTELARQYEVNAVRSPAPIDLAAATTRETRPVTTTSLPPSRTRDPEPVAERPSRPATPVERPVATQRRDGGWRAQLGGFRDVGNARGLFATLQRKGAVEGLTPFLVKAGAITKLQVGPFASSADAARACGPIRRAGSECVPTRK